MPKQTATTQTSTTFTENLKPKLDYKSAVSGGGKHIIASPRVPIFPTKRLKRKLKEVNSNMRTSKDAALFSAAVLEFLVAELLDLSGNIASQYNKKIVTPRHILLGVIHDHDFLELFAKASVSGGGVAPAILEALLPNQSFVSILSHR